MTPAGTSNEFDVQNEWEENTHNTHAADMERKTRYIFSRLTLVVLSIFKERCKDEKLQSKYACAGQPSAPGCRTDGAINRCMGSVSATSGPDTELQVPDEILQTFGMKTSFSKDVIHCGTHYDAVLFSMAYNFPTLLSTTHLRLADVLLELPQEVGGVLRYGSAAPLSLLPNELLQLGIDEVILASTSSFKSIGATSCRFTPTAHCCSASDCPAILPSADGHAISICSGFGNLTFVTIQERKGGSVSASLVRS